MSQAKGETMTLTEFLLARIAEDEAAARKLAETDHRPVLSLATTINHPERLLAECEAKRAIIEWMSRWQKDVALEGTLLLAPPYADHPDCLPEWKP
jgi:hypothetical protein